MVNFLGFYASINLRLDRGDIIRPYVMVHGITFGAWIVLYAVQALLMASHRPRVHMALGRLGALVLILVFLSGFYTIFMEGPLHQAPASQIGRDFASILLALSFGALGLVYRRSAFPHKRLMFYATLILSGAGIARVPLFFNVAHVNPIVVITLMFLPAILLLIYDSLIYKKLPRFNLLCFMSLFLLFLFSAPFLWENQVWTGFVDLVVSFL